MEIGVRVWDDQFPQPLPRGKTVDNLLADVHTRPEPFETRAGHIEEFLQLNPRLAVDIQVLQLREGLEDDCDNVFPLAVVYGHRLGSEGDRDRTNSSGDVRVIDHRPSEEGDALHGQVDFTVQSASSLVAEELADKTCLTKSAEGIDQADNVAVKLQGKTTACDYGRRGRGRGRS